MMLFRSIFRNTNLLYNPSQAIPSVTRLFHATTANMVQVGDSIPNIDVYENSPGNKVNLASELSSGKGLIIGVPAAFSPGCSDHHIPGYLASHKLESAGKVFVISVNDAFVMKAWGKSLDADKKSGIRWVCDPTGEFTRALDLEWDGTPYFGNKRGKRYAMQVQDGKVTKIGVEEDPSKITVSGADENL